MFTAQEFVLKQLLSVAFVKLAFQTYLSACVENNQYDMHIAHCTFTSKQYAFAHCGIKSNQWTFGMTNEIAIKICHHNIFLPKFDCERICRYKLSILSFDWSHTFIPCFYSLGSEYCFYIFLKKVLCNCCHCHRKMTKTNQIKNSKFMHTWAVSTRTHIDIDNDVT